MLPLEFKTFPYLTAIKSIPKFKSLADVTILSAMDLHMPYTFIGEHALSVLTMRTVSRNPNFSWLFLTHSTTFSIPRMFVLMLSCGDLSQTSTCLSADASIICVGRKDSMLSKHLCLSLMSDAWARAHHIMPRPLALLGQGPC